MAEVTWLTQEAFDRLTAELKDLIENKRPENAKSIQSTREEGDLKENAGYHAAREEQAKIESRILQLTELLKDARVGDIVDFDGSVQLGTKVTVELGGSEMTFLFGNREIADASSELDVYSDQSPIGQAINGKKVGDVTSYHTPNGNEIQVKILAVEAFKG